VDRQRAPASGLDRPEAGALLYIQSRLLGEGVLYGTEEVPS
jgi:hypothetical protein